MHITKQQSRDVEVFSIEGQLDSTTSSQLETELLTTTQTGARKLLLDLSGVQMLSSAALRVLLSAVKRTKRQHGRMLLCALNPEIQRVFEICGLAPLFEIYPTRPAALEVLGVPPEPSAPAVPAAGASSAPPTAADRVPPANEEFRAGDTLVVPVRPRSPTPPPQVITATVPARPPSPSPTPAFPQTTRIVPPRMRVNPAGSAGNPPPPAAAPAPAPAPAPPARPAAPPLTPPAPPAPALVAASPGRPAAGAPPAAPAARRRPVPVVGVLVLLFLLGLLAAAVYLVVRSLHPAPSPLPGAVSTAPDPTLPVVGSGDLPPPAQPPGPGTGPDPAAGLPPAPAESAAAAGEPAVVPTPAPVLAPAAVDPDVSSHPPAEPTAAPPRAVPVASVPNPPGGAVPAGPPPAPPAPARLNLDASSQENQQTRAAVLKRIEAAPLSQKNKDQLHQAVDRARAMGRVATIAFASGRTDLGRAELDALKRTLARPEVRALIDDPTTVVVVLGFADSAGNEQKNKEVSDRRAQGVIEALRGPGGVLNVMHGLGMGGSDLFDKTSLERNRVAEIWVVRP